MDPEAVAETTEASPEPVGEKPVPKLASDITRGWVILAISILPILGAPFIVFLLGGGLSLDAITTSGLFIGWSFIAVVSSVVTVAVFVRASPDDLVRWLVATTPRTATRRFLWAISGGGAVAWAVTGSTLAISAVAILSLDPALRAQPIVVWAGVAVVISSLFMMLTAYAVHYARKQAREGGLEFPKTPNPVFVDYLYLAGQVATTFGGSDVDVTTSSMRRSVGIHSLLSMAYNTVIVALLVSVLLSSVL